MQTLEELKTEESLNKKIRQKRRIRGVLIIVNALLIAYAGYLSVASIIDLIKDNKQREQGDVITLLDKTTDKSLELYNEYITESTNIVDVATYGKYLLTSKSKVTHNTFVNEGSVTLFKVVEKNPVFGEPNLVYTLDGNINSQIDLFSLSEGDYLIYSNFDVSKPNLRNAYHYTGITLFEETLYSLPLEDGSRTKITIKGKDSSPALVVSVTNVSAAPETYYDFVVLNTATTKTDIPAWVDKLDKDYSIKYVDSLVDAYKTYAPYAINLIDGEELIISNYINNNGSKSSMIESGVLEGLDTNNSIRELGGYVFNAGYGIGTDGSELMNSISQASIAIKNNLEETHRGKMTVVVGNELDSEEAYQQVKELFELK